MSYYTYAFAAKKTLPEDFEKHLNDYCNSDYLIFDKSEDGFDNLLSYLGEDFLLGGKYIVLEEVEYSYDLLRPHDLNMRILGRESFVGDADYCVPLNMAECAVDFINGDVEVLDTFLYICEALQKEYNTPVILYPL